MGTLTVKNLACTRGTVPIFEGVSFSVGPGAALQVFGANGTGKSTLLQVLAGLVPGEGSVAWSGGEAGIEQPLVPGEIVFQGHGVPLKPQLTVHENLTFWQRTYHGHGDSAVLMKALETVGLTLFAREPARILSAGQRRRLALARCLVARRRLWLLDEPTSALDSAGKALAAQVCRDHLASGGLAIIATHEAVDVPALRLTLAPQKPASQNFGQTTP
ncbi:MAG: heme ABC exporter ATP-binding protein CcmA [Pseudomonadota bacterium]